MSRMEDVSDEIDVCLQCTCGIAPQLRRLADVLKRFEEIEWAMARRSRNEQAVSD